MGAPPTWALSNHDVVRHVSRYARHQDRTGIELTALLGSPADFDLGRRRSRAAVLLTLALPGGAYVYQGEELGHEEVEDLPRRPSRTRPGSAAATSSVAATAVGCRSMVGCCAAVRLQPSVDHLAALAAAAGRVGGLDR